MEFVVGDIQYNIALSADESQLHLRARDINEEIVWLTTVDDNSYELSAKAIFLLIKLSREEPNGNYSAIFPEKQKDPEQIVVEMLVDNKITECKFTVFVTLAREQISDNDLIIRKINAMSARQQQLSRDVSDIHSILHTQDMRGHHRENGESAQYLSECPSCYYLSAQIQTLSREIADLRAFNRQFVTNISAILSDQRNNIARNSASVDNIGAEMRKMLSLLTEMRATKRNQVIRAQTADKSFTSAIDEFSEFSKKCEDIAKTISREMNKFAK